MEEYHLLGHLFFQQKIPTRFLNNNRNTSEVIDNCHIFGTSLRRRQSVPFDDSAFHVVVVE